MVMVSKHEDLLGEKEALVSKIFRGAQKAKFLWFVLEDNGKQNIGRVGKWETDTDFLPEALRPLYSMGASYSLSSQACLITKALLNEKNKSLPYLDVQRLTHVHRKVSSAPQPCLVCTKTVVVRS